MRRWLHTLTAALALALAAASAPAAPPDLAQLFQNPPDSAKPHTWWHWMNGNITREGITADLEAMKKAGVGGAQIFNVDCGIPAGPVVFMTPEWVELMKHAISEANRLGIEICVHNCAGWSSSGGPWNTPEHAMQKVVTSEKRVNGPSKLATALAQPPTTLDFYRDIAVLAFRVPESEALRMEDYKPRITTSAGAVDVKKMTDRQPNTFIKLPLPARAKPQFIQLEFAKPFLARVVKIVPGPGSNGLGGQVQASEDGKKFRSLASFSFPRAGSTTLVLPVGEKPVSARFYRVAFNRTSDRTRQLAVAEVEVSPRVMIEKLDQKAGYSPDSPGPLKWSEPVPGMAVKRADVIDLTANMKPDGSLAWDVPEGQWVIQRIGYTPTGKNNHPAPAAGTGPECDKMSREAMLAHWNGMMKTLLDAVGPLAGKSLNNALVDSYEVGGQNWTPRFREEFQKRRGYDPVPFLPTLTGRIIDSPEVTERFLWDLRRTISDLFAENYYAYFAELCHQHGLKASIEPYSGPFESLQVGAPADIPMGEFWSGSNGHGSVKLAASVGHIYGRPVIGAESFTASPEPGRWQNDPWSFKALGDKIYCTGVNRYIFHRYAHQPWMDKLPGMTMGQWGFHFERTNGWWDQGRAWLQYVARCQALLQSGVFQADVAYFMGEDSPAEATAREQLKPALPDGYDFDCLGADVLLKHMSVKDGRIALEGGMTYRVLALPASARYTPATLRKIKELVEAGAVVVGPRPVGSPSLQNYPQCDDEVRALAGELWGAEDGKLAVERTVGKGKVISGKSLEETFAALDVDPDYACLTKDARTLYIHRDVAGAQVYFVSNQRPVAQELECAFRVSGMTPELWHADSGKMEQAPAWSEKDGRTIVPLRFDPAGSVFVVFRKKAEAADHAASAAFAAASEKPAGPKLTIKKATYEAVDGAGAADVTAMINDLLAQGQSAIEVENKLSGKDPAYLHVKQLRVEYELDGRTYTKLIPEHGLLELPELAQGSAPPTCELTAAEGKLELAAWQNGALTVKTAAGKEARAEVQGLAAPQEVTGPWQVAFPPNWGAPAQATFEKLVSWTARPEPGIKYFSGTATYTKTFDIPQSAIGDPQSAILLDLGQLKNLAEVTLNGQNLGILWKPPYRLDITKAAKAGANALEVKVTNMWCNRLIGDEQLPDDCEWQGKQLKAWPQWLLEGKPRPSGRLTFTTWHHFDKDSPLYEAGLFGPVTVWSGRKLSVELPK